MSGNARCVFEVRTFPNLSELTVWAAARGLGFPRYLGPDLTRRPVWGVADGCRVRVAIGKEIDPRPAPIEWRSPLAQLDSLFS